MALKAVGGDFEATHAEEGETISALALAGIKNIAQNADVAIDLHSAVYMYHLTQALIKHVSQKDAYNTYVGKGKVLSHQNSLTFTQLKKNCKLLTVSLCNGFLSRKWFSFEGREMQGGEFNSLLEQLLKGYFKDAKYSFIRANLQWIESEASGLKTRGGNLLTFPCIKM